jgi:hypothetical protein
MGRVVERTMRAGVYAPAARPARAPRSPTAGFMPGRKVARRVQIGACARAWPRVALERVADPEPPDRHLQARRSAAACGSRCSSPASLPPSDDASVEFVGAADACRKTPRRAGPLLASFRSRTSIPTASGRAQLRADRGDAKRMGRAVFALDARRRPASGHCSALDDPRRRPRIRTARRIPTNSG